MLQSTYNHGFVIKFDNNFSISVQFSKLNTSGRGKKIGDDLTSDINEPIVQAQTADVTLYDNQGKAIILNDNIILPYQSADDVARLIGIVSAAECIGDVWVAIHGEINEEWM